jgi:3-oxoacyl-[acyl-carrier protein] reductase
MVTVAELPQAFRGRRAVIVGGQGGVGGAIVAQLAALGARIVSASRRGAAAWQPPADGAVATAQLDLADPGSLDLFSAQVQSAFGALDLLVNTAGTSRQAPLPNLDDALIDAVFASNTTGPLKLIRRLAPLLRQGTQPAIVNISSVAARTGLGSNIAYGGAKAAMDAMMVGLAKALAPEVRTVSISPSALDTPFAVGRGPDFTARTIAQTPLGRLATLDEVATAALVAAAGLGFTTGAVIPVDGGRSL